MPLADIREQWTFLLVKPDAMASMGADAIADEVRSRASAAHVAGEFWLNGEDVDDWYPDIRDEPHYAAMVRYLTSGPVAVIHMTAPEPFATAKATKRAIRSRWGSGELRNWVHSPDSAVDRDSEWELFRPRLRRFAVAPLRTPLPARGR